MECHNLWKLSLACLSLVVPLWVAAQTETPPSHGLLLVANKGNQTLGIVDPDTGREVAEIPEGGITGHEVAASPEGSMAYVPIYGNSGVGKPGTGGRTMAVIDLASRRVVKTLDFDMPLRPHGAVFGPKNGLLYVTTELANSITVIDPKSLRIVSSIPTGQRESHMLAITHDGQRGYTANVGPGTVSAIDLVAQKPLAIIPISRQTQRISLSINDSVAEFSRSLFSGALARDKNPCLNNLHLAVLYQRFEFLRVAFCAHNRPVMHRHDDFRLNHLRSLRRLCRRHNISA